MIRLALVVALLGAGVSAPAQDGKKEGKPDPEEHFDRFARRVVERDSFPVFDDPAMLSVEEAEASGAVKARDPVIGVALNGEAKAYPVPVMGVHELGNDTIGGVPIAPSW